jgi:hypothetical protein
MDFNTTIDIIIKDLREAREIIDDLKNYPGVPRLQVELAKSKCKSAEEVIALLKTIQAENVNPVAEKKITEPVVADPVKTKVEPLIEISEDEEASIIADRFSDMPDTIHESFGKISHDEDISSLIKSKPVFSLSEAIGINDKFLFIREVFGGSHSNYDEAISKLNKVENLADAKAVIMSYTGESDENEVVVQLLGLVKRKLSSDG